MTIAVIVSTCKGRFLNKLLFKSLSSRKVNLNILQNREDFLLLYYRQLRVQLVDLLIGIKYIIIYMYALS